MRLGFIGVGTIAKAIIDGLMHSDIILESVVLSPRNNTVAEALKQSYQKITVAKNNQEVVSSSDIIFLCTPSQNTKEVLKELSFKSDQILVSLVAMANKAEIEEWSGYAASVYRAVPLPFVAEGKGVTPLYPACDVLKVIFDALGGTIILEKEDDFSLYLLAGSMMGIYYRFMGACQDFLEEQGLEKEASTIYLAKMFYQLAHVMDKREVPDFLSLQKEYSTPGGTNALLAQSFEKYGGIEILKRSAVEALQHIKRC